MKISTTYAMMFTFIAGAALGFGLCWAGKVMPFQDRDSEARNSLDSVETYVRSKPTTVDSSSAADILRLVRKDVLVEPKWFQKYDTQGLYAEQMLEQKTSRK